MAVEDAATFVPCLGKCSTDPTGLKKIAQANRTIAATRLDLGDRFATNLHVLLGLKLDC